MLAEMREEAEGIRPIEEIKRDLEVCYVDYMFLHVLPTTDISALPEELKAAACHSEYVHITNHNSLKNEWTH